MPYSKYNKTLMKAATLFAGESHCLKGKVGAVLSKDGRVLVSGYNGTIQGANNNCEYKYISCPDCNSDIKIKNNELTISCKNVDCNTVVFYETLKELKAAIKLRTNVNVIHAEANAILFAAKYGIALTGTTMYVTMSPCVNCAKMIVQAGISNLFYKDLYRDTSGITYLKKYLKVERIID